MPNPLDQLAQRIADLEDSLPELSRSSRLAYSSVDDGALTVTAGGTVRAVIGQQPDGTTAVNVINGPTPPVPSPPVVTPALGGVLAVWDGTFAGGSPAPLDLGRIEVHASPTAGFTPGQATLVTTVESPQGGSVLVPTGQPVWVLLMARSTSGRASAPSGAAQAGPAKVVADSVLAGIIGELALADDAVTAAKVAAGAIDADAIAAAAVTAAKLGAAAVTAGKIAPDAVGKGTIAADSVTAREVVAGTISTRELAAGAVTTTQLAAGAVTTTQLAAGSVTAGQLAAGAVTTPTIAAGAITTAQLAADSVAAGTIAAGAITGREIKALAITADKLAVNSITADKLAAGAVTATSLAADAIDGKTIKGVTVIGSTVQTGLTGRRVLLSPESPEGDNAPSVSFYSGDTREKVPAEITAYVAPNPAGIASVTRVTSPQLTDNGTHTPSVFLSAGSPADGYSPAGVWSLDATGGWTAGAANLYGTAGTGTDEFTEARVQTEVYRTDTNKPAVHILSPSSWKVQLADQVAAMYLSKSGLLVKALVGTVEVQSSAVQLTGCNLMLTHGARITTDDAWITPVFQNGCSQLAGWQRVQFKRLPHGFAALRGIVAIPAAMTGGVIFNISAASGCRPLVGEVFAGASATNVGANVFVYPSGDVVLTNATGGLGGWLSFGSLQWSCVD
ncbi:hypothetical protein OG455_27685 [Kitasatospora sp. NBC_01287]|uniref:hypothetical protein n=1 Tax=Kitasatospora sp. NBC_01287 TaxID=2903573 RepID=UPI00225A56BF|nr:hypothetical protein [Kitasatospora sp. NBC_01287]MCX4749243.1 hypothetical protein [Kitasatospora sp. NBC_01287]